MSDPAPAPDWHSQQQTPSTPPAMPAPPPPGMQGAPPAPFPAAPAPAAPAPAAPAQLQGVPAIDAPAPMPSHPMPTDPAAALDVTAPLAGAMPQAMEHALVEPRHPQSMAMPHDEPISITAAADEPADAASVWWAPGNALVLAVAALAWQFVSYYARVQLPIVESSGAPLTNFDSVVSNLPLAGSSLGPIVGLLLAAGALAIVLVGTRKGLREPALQGGIGALSLVSMLLVAVLPKIAG